jgi:hypothetical protein
MAVTELLTACGEEAGSYRDADAFIDCESKVQELGKAGFCTVWKCAEGFAIEQSQGGRVRLWVDCSKGTAAKLRKLMAA